MLSDKRAKCICRKYDPDQTALSKHSDLGQNFLLLVICLYIKGPFYPITQLGYCISLPNDKILAMSKLKAFADDKINMTEKIEICFGTV